MKYVNYDGNISVYHEEFSVGQLDDLVDQIVSDLSHKYDEKKTHVEDFLEHPSICDLDKNDVPKNKNYKEMDRSYANRVDIRTKTVIKNIDKMKYIFI